MTLLGVGSDTIGGFFAGAFGVDQLVERNLVAILELVRIEMTLLALQDMSGKLEHVGWHLGVRDVVEIVLLVADLGVVAQRGREQSLAARLQQQQALAPVDHELGQRRELLLAHGLADHGEGFLRRLVLRHDVE